MATTLGNTAVGSIVKLKENGVAQNYIVVHQGNPSATIYDSSCNGTWLLRQDTIEKRVWDSGNVNKYEESDIHSWLNLVMLAKYDADIQSAIKQVKIPYRHGGGTGGIDQHGANGLSTKPFLLSSREIGLTLSDSVDGSKLEYFLYADSLEARVKRQANTNWWLRSLYTSETSYVYIIDSNGPYGGSLTNGKVGVRPVIILPPTLIANDDGSIITNTAPSVPSSISVPSTITDGDTITVSVTRSPFRGAHLWT